VIARVCVDDARVEDALRELRVHEQVVDATSCSSTTSGSSARSVSITASSPCWRPALMFQSTILIRSDAVPREAHVCVADHPSASEPDSCLQPGSASPSASGSAFGKCGLMQPLASHRATLLATMHMRTDRWPARTNNPTHPRLRRPRGPAPSLVSSGRVQRLSS
jgi:hypothetical protein